jgi:PilZ domain-containing protein
MYLAVTSDFETPSPMDLPQCPICGDGFTRRIQQPEGVGALTTPLQVFPFHCQLCALQFWSRSSGLQSSPSERRKYARVAVFLEASFSGGGVEGQGTVLNLSMSGCGIESAAPVREKIIVSLGIHIAPNHPPIEVQRAMIQYRTGKRFGLEFLQMEAAQKERLRVNIQCLLRGATPAMIVKWLNPERSKTDSPENR